MPISGAFDFEAAFPSIIHDWLWMVLRPRKMPPDYINLFQSIYKNAHAFYAHNGITFTLLAFLSGVLQGCPGSAFLFNNAIDPFLTSFNNVLRSNNARIVGACADDTGITLCGLKHLQLIYPIHCDRKTFGGLILKPIKCVLAPLCRVTDEVQSSTYHNGILSRSSQLQS